jgi:processive 1,2-diacylglycerol beta-glucosyltransferase
MAIGARLRDRLRRASTQDGGAPTRGAHPRRVLILSANVGEGHAAAARAIAQDVALHDPTAEVTIIDGLAAMGGLIRHVVQDGYEVQLRVAPWSADLVYWLLHNIIPARWVARFLLRTIGSRSLLETIESYDPDVVVSTYPAITIVLGMLRRRGHLHMPTAAAITDLAGLFFWADRGVDLHLLAYEESLKEVERVAGAGSAHVTRGLVALQFQAPHSREEAREALGLSQQGRVVIVSGGGWGIGDLEGSIREALSVDDVTVLVLAGRNEELKSGLENAFASDSRVRVLGFTDRINDLLAAADAMVHSTAGVTCLEARARGCPVVVYGAQIAHIRVNAREMAKREIVDVAHSPAELREALTRALAGEGARIRPIDPTLPAAGALLEAARIRVQPRSRMRLAVPRVVASAALTLAPVWTFVSPTALGIHATTSVPTSQREVALVVRAPRDLIAPLRKQLNSEGMEASFAIDASPATYHALRSAGAHGVPALPGGATHWFHAARDLRREANELGLSHRFYYVRPRHQFSLADYFFAGRAGGRAVAPRELLPEGGSSQMLNPGEIVVLDVTRDNAGIAAAAIDRTDAQLRASRLSAVALDTLLAAGGSGN